MRSRQEVIKEVFEIHGSNSLYITSTGYISRIIFSLYPSNTNIFYMQGSMGLSPAIALGLALSTKQDVVSFVGDASLLMHLGITHTIRDYNLSNLFIYVLDNGCHESVGCQSCSVLEKTYPGIEKIYKINKEGKSPRVLLSCLKNKTDFMTMVFDEK